MSYKLLEITTCYDKFIDSFYSSNPDYISLPYKDQFSRLTAECFAESNFIHLELAGLGVDSTVVFYNIEGLQRAWNNDCKGESLFEILLKQVESENPDVILVSDLFVFSIAELNEIKKKTKQSCIFVGFVFTTITEALKKKLPFFDEIYTGNKFMVRQIGPMCKSVKLLGHAFYPKILDKLDIKEIREDLSFSGSIMVGYHTNRLEMFSRIIDGHLPYSFYGEIYGSLLPFGNIKSVRTTVRNILKIDKETQRLRNTERKLRKNSHAALFGIPYYKAIASHLICLNQHTPVAGTGCGNMRMFEATGVGACLLTDYKEDIEDLFAPDEEIVVYRTYDELVEKARWLLDNPGKAREIAAAGQKRTLATHTYKQKAEILNGYLLLLLHQN